MLEHWTGTTTQAIRLDEKADLLWTYLHYHPSLRLSCADVIESESSIRSYTGEDGRFGEVESNGGHCFVGCRECKV